MRVEKLGKGERYMREKERETAKKELNSKLEPPREAYTG